MLVEFSVENYGSIRDEQTVSFVASKYFKEADEWAVECGAPGLKTELILKAASIFGANASGKSTVIDALNHLWWLVRSSAGLMPDMMLPFNPFKLDCAHRSAPSTFKIIFTVDDVRYDYEVSHRSDRVTNEKLEKYETGRSQLMFHRYTDDSDNVRLKLTSKMSGLKKVLPFLENKPTSLVLSRAAQEGFDPLMSPYNWIAKQLRFSEPDEKDASSFGPILDGAEGDDIRTDLIKITSHADLGIVGIKSKSEPFLERMSGIEQVLSQEALERLKDMPFKTAVFTHSAEDGSVDFESGSESVGTLAFLGVAADALLALRDGAVLSVDEIDRSLHPALVREIIRLFADEGINKNHAQLLFTAHAPQLMDELRRDQVWLTTKWGDGATTVEPLSDYSVRKSERKSVGYELGRYGAVPYVDGIYASLVGA